MAELAAGAGYSRQHTTMADDRPADVDRQRQLWYKTPESVEAMAQRQVIKTTLLGEEIARAALFLAADDSRMMTKQSLTVDAGIR